MPLDLLLGSYAISARGISSRIDRRWVRQVAARALVGVDTGTEIWEGSLRTGPPVADLARCAKAWCTTQSGQFPPTREK